jgi:LmbE family N-acetylglucosaminyl deacetylase
VSDPRPSRLRALGPTARSGLRLLLRTAAVDRTQRTAARRCLVLAPHPDDDVLGCGGTIAVKRAIDTDVRIVVVTDGAVTPGTWHRSPALAVQRRDEARRAAARLGIASEEVVFYDFPDGELDRHGSSLLERLRAEVRSFVPDEVLSTAPSDPHADHAAVGRACRALLDEGAIAVLLEYPVWQWRSPSAFARTWLASGRLRPDVVDVRAHAGLKREALDEHCSQVEVGDDGAGWTLDPRFLQSFLTGREWFFPVRR